MNTILQTPQYISTQPDMFQNIKDGTDIIYKHPLKSILTHTTISGEEFPVKVQTIGLQLNCDSSN